MKLNKAQAIARRNTELGGAVLGVNNCHFTDLDRKRNIWWFDLPLGRIAVGQYEWIHLLMHNAETDQLLHLKVPTAFLREKLEGLGGAQCGQAQAGDHLGAERGQGFVPQGRAPVRRWCELRAVRPVTTRLKCGGRLPPMAVGQSLH